MQGCARQEDPDGFRIRAYGETQFEEAVCLQDRPGAAVVPGRTGDGLPGEQLRMLEQGLIIAGGELLGPAQVGFAGGLGVFDLLGRGGPARESALIHLVAGPVDPGFVEPWRLLQRLREMAIRLLYLPFRVGRQSSSILWMVDARPLGPGHPLQGWRSHLLLQAQPDFAGLVFGDGLQPQLFVLFQQRHAEAIGHFRRLEVGLPGGFQGTGGLGVLLQGQVAAAQCVVARPL